MVISRGDHETTAALGSKARFQPNRDTHSESNYQHRGCTQHKKNKRRNHKQLSTSTLSLLKCKFPGEKLKKGNLCPWCGDYEHSYDLFSWREKRILEDSALRYGATHRKSQSVFDFKRGF